MSRESSQILSLVQPPPLSGDDADAWHALGCELERLGRPLAQVRVTYHRALERDPGHAGALVNLGRLLHEAGDLEAAGELYGRAMEAGDAIGAYNLGVVLDEVEEIEAARAAYIIALDRDPRLADAHWNLARLEECRGERAGALRHLLAYRRLTEAG